MKVLIAIIVVWGGVVLLPGWALEGDQRPARLPSVSSTVKHDPQLDDRTFDGVPTWLKRP